MKKYLFLVLCVLICVMTAGCKSNKQSPVITPTATPSGIISTTLDKQRPSVPETKELTIYTISSDFSELVETYVLLAKETDINSRIVTDNVVESLSDISLDVKICGVTEANGRVVVDFASDCPPAKDVSMNVEELILDAIAQSILDNISDSVEVGFTMEGNDYRSDNLHLEKTEAYLKK